MVEVRGPTRTKVKVPVTELKLLPGAVLVSVPGPTKEQEANESHHRKQVFLFRFGKN
jgi:hypothetical protein